MKLVSIIIPYFNNIKFIKKTIDSILNQTYQNFEVIIVYDDENHDDLRVIKQLIYNQNKIKLTINKKKNWRWFIKKCWYIKCKWRLCSFY